MAKEKPLTLSELAKYHKKTLAPFMKENFATKKEIECLIDIVATKDELHKAKNEILGEIKKRFNSVDENLKGINKLEIRVVDIENVLNMPSIKKQ